MAHEPNRRRRRPLCRACPSLRCLSLDRRGSPVFRRRRGRGPAPVLEAAAVDPGIFDHVVDGTEATRLGLPGKPDPAVFLEAAARLGARPEQSVVVEDAVSGVEAGRAGGFGGVIGVDRGDNLEALEGAGADFVVRDLDEVVVR